jgi:hypothetical protein
LSQDDHSPGGRPSPPDGPRKQGGEPGAPRPDGQESGGLTPRRFRFSIAYLIVLVIVLFAVKQLLEEGGNEASYDEFLHHLRKGHVEEVLLGDDYHTGWMTIPPGAADAKQEAPAAEERPVLSNTPELCG